jgi:hypothetical protein
MFTDGTSYGDPKDVAELMERRQVKLTALADAASVLCDAQRKGNDMNLVVGVLEKRKSQFSTTGTPGSAEIQTEVYTAAIDEVKKDSLHGSDAIGNGLRFLQSTGAPLLEDPVRDAGGKPYLRENTVQLSCGQEQALSGTRAAQPAPKPYSAHPMVALREGFYVRTGLATDRWPPKQERVFRVFVVGNEINVVEISGSGPAAAAGKETPIFHGAYVSNPFQGDWGSSHGKMPMVILSPERFLFGSEGSSTGDWNRLSDTAARH